MVSKTRADLPREPEAGFAVLFAWASIPQGLTFEEAAGYPSVVETAIRIINEVGVQPAETLLVSGAQAGSGRPWFRSPATVALQ